jgi:hypothetical protein
MSFRSILLAAVLGAPVAASLAHGVEGQRRTALTGPRNGAHVAGHVVDQTTGSDLSSVRLTFTSLDSARVGSWVALSDSLGRFEIDWLPLGAYELHGEGLALSDFTRPLRFSQSGTADLRIEMAPAALELEPIIVTATRPTWLAEEGFYERRARGLGYSLAREEIEARNPYVVSDLFYGIPGADVISERTGRTPAIVLLRGRCVPQVVLDGAPFSAPIALDHVVAVQDVEAIEVYQGSTSPIRYSTSSCGTIMVWTKRAVPGEGSPLTWTRFLAALGISAWITWSLW